MSQKSSNAPPIIQSQSNAVIRAFSDEAVASRICSTVTDLSLFHFVHPGRGLYSTALTCKTLHKPAINAIWSRLETIVPLVRLLPPSCWQLIQVPMSPEALPGASGRTVVSFIDEWDVREHQERDDADEIREHLKIRRRLTKDDCKRVVYYASLVKSFSSSCDGFFNSAGHVFVDENVYHHLFDTLSKEYGQNPLFPNLESLRWTVYNDAAFPSFATLFPPGLRSLEVSLYGDQRLNQFSAKFPACCPKLRVLRLLHSKDMGALGGLASEVADLDQLEKLEIDSVSTDAYMRLAKHPSLATLTIKSIDAVDWNVVAAQLSSMSTFQSLKALSITSSHMDDCIEMLKTINQSSMKNLRVHLHGGQLGEDWGRLTQTIQTQCSPDHLRSIQLTDKINQGEEPTEELYDSPFTPEDLEPLFVFKKLTCLFCQICCTIEVDDDCIRTATESFPQLTDFCLLSKLNRRAVFESPPVQINSLVYFSQNCPELRHLGLSVDARWPKASETLCGDPDAPSKVEFLHVGYSHVMSAHVLAGIFSDWFPKLSTVRMGAANRLDATQAHDPFETSDDRAKKEWEEIPKLMKYMLKVRMQERKSLKRRRDGNGEEF